MYTPFLKYDRFSICFFLRGNSFLYMSYDLYEFSIYLDNNKMATGAMFWNYIFAKWIIKNSEDFELIDGHLIQS